MLVAGLGERGLTNFHTRLAKGKKRIGPKQLPVDGYDGEEEIPGEFPRPDGGIYQRISVVSPKEGNCWLPVASLNSLKAACLKEPNVPQVTKLDTWLFLNMINYLAITNAFL